MPPATRLPGVERRARPMVRLLVVENSPVSAKAGRDPGKGAGRGSAAATSPVAERHFCERRLSDWRR